MTPRWLVAALGVAALCPSVAEAQSTARRARVADSTWSFVVLGHVRGEEKGLHPRLGELLDEVRDNRPAVAVLTGDAVWGDWRNGPSRPEVLAGEFGELDSALATLDVPVLRVPGNHEIHDLASRDAYVARYGIPPKVEYVHGSRFILLNSVWVPADGDTSRARYIRGLDLDSAQVAFLKDELARPTTAQHTFVFLHHLLWWEDDSGPWWKEVHPLLAAAGVRAVFSGDYGPMKFSHLQRDGVEYFQSSLSPGPSLEMLRSREASRALDAQFDTYLRVVVDSRDAVIHVETTGEASSGFFTPARWAEIYRYRPPPPPLRDRLWDLIGSPARLVALGLIVAVSFIAGAAAGVRRWRSEGRTSR